MIERDHGQEANQEAGPQVRSAAPERSRQELEASELQYRQLVELAQDGIWTIDADGNTTYVNPRMAEMLGYSAEEMSGKHLFEFMDDRGKELCRRNMARREQGITEVHEFEFLHKSGRRLYTRVNTCPISDAEGAYLGAHAVITDITEDKRVREELARAKDEAEAAHWALIESYDDLSRTDTLRECLVGHTFLSMKDPLLEMQSQLRKLLDGVDGPLNQDQSRRARHVCGVTQSLSRGNQVLLALNSLESGTLPLRTEQVDGVTLLRDALREVEYSADLHTIRAVGSDVPVPLRVDPVLVRRVVTHLLDRALQRTPPGESIGLTWDVQTGDLRVTVSDSGEAIPVNHQEVLFQRCTPSRWQNHANLEPWGHGLAFCSLAIKAHRGTIEMETEPGKDTRIIVRIPVEA